MIIIRALKQMSEFSRRARLCGQAIGFVPTMGALHAGHASLIRRARRDNDKVVVSIFVNPIQFGPQEDFQKYPRNLKQDARLCRKEGADAVFYPACGDIYPDNYKTYVTVEDLSDCLCGKLRPGHFKGVATVVTKLFNIVSPDAVYFGQKDAQQAIIIKKMADDLNISVKVKVMPTVREKDGLAISSRNVYLNRDERKDALVLPQALNLARDLVNRGERDTDKVTGLMRQLIQEKNTAKIDYIAIVELKNLSQIREISGTCLIALAVWIGRTRLIDNIIIKLKPPKSYISRGRLKRGP